jgi:hypothetical protein
MSTPARTPGLYGRRPPKRAPAIRFSAIRRAAAPPLPAAVDYLAPMDGGWLMLGNGPDDSVFPGFQGCGDCEAARWANTRRVITTTLTPTPVYPGWPLVLEAYQTQNPAFDPAGPPDTTGPGSPADGGMDTQTFLEWLVAHPGALDGGECVGFALVDHTNPEEVQAAVDAGGALWLDINVQASNQTEFSNDQPWTYTPGDPVEGGHAVLFGGYGTSPAGSDPAMAGLYKDETWAAESSLTPLFWANLVVQLWFPIWAEQLGTKEFQAGVDEAAFAAEYTAITGKPFPGTIPPAPPVPPSPPPAPPSPPPAPPTPPAPPDPDPADRELAAAVTSWAQERHPLSGSDRQVAAALTTWLTAKGFIT